MKRTAVIMAGGGGTRFWPLSRADRPKQLLKLAGDRTMLNETIHRLEGVISADATFIVTNEIQAEFMRQDPYPGMPDANIFCEPSGRNTAPCILYATMRLMQLYGEDCLIAVLASDHFIENVPEYQRILELAFDTAEETNAIVTLGIEPTKASTGYGYIHYQPNQDASDLVCEVKAFAEKPEQNLADQYFASKKYLWNSGMFVWKASVILEAFSRHLPDMIEAMEGIREDLGTQREAELLPPVYETLEKISVDYGIMEHITGAKVIRSDFGWNDIGAWDSLGSVLPSDEAGNVVHGEHIGLDTKNSVVYGSDNRLISTIGLDNIVIVDTPDALLVCDLTKSQSVKTLVDTLREKGYTSYL